MSKSKTGKHKKHEGKPGSSPPETRWKTHLFSLLLIALVSVIIYSNIYSCPFVFDDLRSLVDNYNLRDDIYYGSISKIFIPRRIVFLTFVCNYQLGGLNVFGYHLVNLLIHILSGFAAYFLARILLRLLTPYNSKLVSLMSLATALVFAVHPIQTQAVTYTIQRFASMAALFFMVSVLCYSKVRSLQACTIAKSETRSEHEQRTGKKQQSGWLVIAFWYIFAILSGMLAFLSKQNTACLPGIILLVEWLCFDRSWKAWKKKLLFVLLMCTGWLLFVSYAMGLFQTGNQVINVLEDVSSRMRQTVKVSRWGYLCTQFNVITIYVRLLFLPVKQNLDYLYKFKQGFLDGLTPLAFLFLTGIVALGVASVKKHPLVTLSVGWFFATLAVESSFFPISDAMFEHRLYLPLFAFSLTLPYAIQSLILNRISRPGIRSRSPRAPDFNIQHGDGKSGHKGFIIILLVITTALGVATYRRNLVWQSSETLWKDVIAKAPLNPRAYTNLGMSYFADRRIREAIEAYKKALSLDSNRGRAWSNLGVALNSLGNTKEAYVAFKRATEIHPDFAQGFNNLGNALTLMKRNSEAVTAYQKAIELKPNYAEAYGNLGNALVKLDQPAEAVNSCRRAVELEPGFDKAYYIMGKAYVELNETEHAITTLKKALELDQSLSDASLLLGKIYWSTGQSAAAERVIKQAVNQQTSNASFFRSLGTAYFERKQTDKAIEAYTKAIQIDPASSASHYNLGIIHFNLGDLDRALELYSKAVELDPTYGQAHNNLALTYFRQESYDLAVKHADRAVELGVDVHPGFLKSLEKYR